jgi:cobalamin biosynthesis protein CobD/CbiB
MAPTSSPSMRIPPSGYCRLGNDTNIAKGVDLSTLYHPYNMSGKVHKRVMTNTAQRETSFLSKVNLGIHCCLRVLSVIPVSELFIYALYFVIAFVIEVICLAIT